MDGQCWNASISDNTPGVDEHGMGYLATIYTLAHFPATDKATLPPTTIRDRLCLNMCRSIIYPWIAMPGSKYTSAISLGPCRPLKFPM